MPFIGAVNARVVPLRVARWPSGSSRASQSGPGSSMKLLSILVAASKLQICNTGHHIVDRLSTMKISTNKVVFTFNKLSLFTVNLENDTNVLSIQ